ncbi:hypothetical protein OU995_18530 [Roseateles sp. SL47]|uniref:hypothetical protein n=1 Tax=Roseateles sp. SL47 TaxID=2995138 RepID=UPI0022714B2E|nr:hypothetical protein [Roseateles sp. SL47]WAC71568.1 hypothetical protein OU995_18530 [Roseateles sp. SL47]
MHGERKAHLGAGVRAGTQGRGGHASAGISADLAAQVRGQAGAGRPTLEDLTAPLLAINGEAQAGASFDQYARAGLPPLRLANETLVDEPVGVGQKSHGFVGARAEAKGSVGPTHAQGHVETFAGAKTGGQAELTLGDQRFKVNGDLRAGIGLDASASAGLKRTPEGRTRLQLEGRLGGALGVGGAIGGGVDLDVTPVADAVDALPRPARNGLKSLVHTGGRIVKSAADLGKAAVKAVGKVAKEVVTAPVRFIKSLFS